MAEIQLINKKTGRAGAFPLALLDWNAMIASGITPFSYTMANVSEVTDTHKTFYYLDNADVSSFISGVIRPDSDKNLFYVGSHQNYRDNFQPESAAIPWSTFDSVDTWQVPVQNVNALEGHGNFQPNRMYYSNSTVCTDYRTANGGEIGGSVGLYGADGNVYAVMCVGAKQTSYIRGLYQQYNADYCARWRGNGCIDFSTHPTRNYSTAPVAEVLGVQTVDPIPAPSHLVSQCVYAEISGYRYIAMCSITTDADGNPKMLSGVFIPAWFWGDYDAPEDPADIPQYHGRDAVPQRTSGSYSYTMVDVDLPTATQPFALIDALDTGLHVYRISESSYSGIQETLWGGGTLGLNLWQRFQNYKLNPIAGIIACHRIPKEFMPTVDNTFVQPKAAGAPLLTLSDVKYLNATTTVTETARTVTLPEYFSSHLNWDPYTSVQLFLPFCGWITLPADRCIDTTENGSGSISVQYRCDIITGNVVAFIRCFDGNGKNTFSTQASGNCALSVPITGNDQGTGGVIGAVTAAAGVAAGAFAGLGAAALIGGSVAAGLATQTARHTMQAATQYSGNVAALGALCPYLVITMPVEHTSEEWRQLHGLPSGIGLTVGDLEGTGYTELSEFHAEIDCISAEEQQEIENLMKGGVIL